jgi:hypothetical protein
LGIFVRNLKHSPETRKGAVHCGSAVACFDTLLRKPPRSIGRDLGEHRPTSQPMSKHELEVHKVLHGDVALRNVATDEERMRQKAAEHDEEVFSVDVAAQKLQKGWGIRD